MEDRLTLLVDSIERPRHIIFTYGAPDQRLTTIKPHSSALHGLGGGRCEEEREFVYELGSEVPFDVEGKFVPYGSPEK